MIEVYNISKSFLSGRKKIQVLCDISFELERGKILTVIGKSGSGKTTLLNCIGGLEVPDSGRVSCLGMDIHSLSKKELCHFQRNKLGFVFQSGNLLSYLTTFENIVFPLILNGYTKKDSNKRVKELLERVGLTQHAKAMPNELSGGQAQRAAFARAIAHSPDILLADEPTASIDTQTGLNLITLMCQLGRENNSTIIISTHDNEIIKHADKIIRLKDGKITGVSNEKMV
ncbi:MAG: ABC transporter ATP-binding protein [Deltaproteobacteria bacterium]|nr:ABC transporter ATP-binding protein [Deltaproteobacteria bacterium]